MKLLYILQSVVVCLRSVKSGISTSLPFTPWSLFLAFLTSVSLSGGGRGECTPHRGTPCVMRYSHMEIYLEGIPSYPEVIPPIAGKQKIFSACIRLQIRSSAYCMSLVQRRWG